MRTPRHSIPGGSSLVGTFLSETRESLFMTSVAGMHRSNLIPTYYWSLADEALGLL